MSQGLHISFLGVDGIGKTSLATRLARLLGEHGLPVRLISWRGTLDEEEDPQPWPGVALQQLWLETFRLLYGGASCEGEPLDLPRDYVQWRDGGYEDRMGRSDVRGTRPAGPMAAALAELAGNVVLFPEVVRPAVQRGEIVIQETFPYKHVLKQLLIAERLQTDPAQVELIGHAMSFMTTMFGSALFQPDIGVLVDGPVSLAYAWRIAESGHVGALEDFSAAGEHGEASFHRLQEETADAFRRVAKDWDWLVHTVDGTGLEENMRQGVELITAHPALRATMAGRRAGRG
ncbi:hypothetical protein [Streptomyces chromofuscus]|uniref:hypothetical protein n=1 Tax=Streptomyces chromofuscus TaxID=42881 RepID=UPI001675E3B8|nr:hypothetical protein [Streptomyces chromofuscus]GGT43232.1 hypothetical protein GCM10010254_73230 [Streptomyces chromofuscus]